MNKVTVYQLMIQGWGDNEDDFYSFGTFNTRKKAEDAMESHLKDWASNGQDRNDVVWEIEEHEVL
jgi:hypothetical protein